MRSENSTPILDKIGKDPGFKVPENYFENFMANMEQSLPEKQFEQESERSLWSKVRPYIYMAAMFAGILCTMKVFSTLSGNNNPSYNPVIAKAFENKTFVDDFVYTNDFDDYTLMQDMVQDSIEQENANIDDADISADPQN